MPKFIKRLSRAKKCPLCEQDVVVDYKDTVLLKKYVSERGKILGRARSGICANHQRQVTRGIKRARYIALMPFVQT
ncbi:30S ribosomal protein S18 [Candidatus Curtissbacteria bacterium RIFCSPLOWO2_01_FULL_38_11b]|uniref:Small ribosomal subunit protein bS18 n=1 Tax=Candidatus Curtissbacteria bacterium RIFCSPLOWO2_01_FULL_38_11b TaxID=1797725 RepID=A0A1F5H073_9BACT|nr:MAG: 30S ribosomal protein S18 [Candidatus Curtissbacteria bacterium RIFCSPLOWO2_01_FULL_38_11b]